ncbi:hypothetical protein TELCIR_03143 [Teladorsagia circumcincta]|uniref:Uncharacterized protein n=1 Tax=Teladorsagia circumcincta TaxID=45464 RepID=A0A2G9UX88_TELCI|nr:hypothetical protein TELCIR_03143 [Teladorsagia circumcincta]
MATTEEHLSAPFSQRSLCPSRFTGRSHVATIGISSVVQTIYVSVDQIYASRNRIRRTDSEQARIEMKSFEETKYLRRYSELNPLQARRHSIDN